MMRKGPKSIRKARAALAGLGAVVVLATTGATRAETWRLARGPSSIEFTIGHLIFSEVSGRFGRFDGVVSCPNGCSDDDMTKARIDVTIDVTSVYTGHADRDRELMNEDFFAADRFPEMRFESRAIERTAQDGFRVLGELTIRGVTLPVALEALSEEEHQTSTGRRRDFRASGSIHRSDYGMTWNDTWAGRLVVADEVRINLSITLVEAAG